MLSPLGYDRLAIALDETINRRRSRDPFPSVREIREILEPEARPEDEAAEIASRIVRVVARIGPYREAAARDALGPLGWDIVQRQGGWMTVCEMLSYDNLPQLQAQWRRLAEARIRYGGVCLPELRLVANGGSPGGLTHFGESILKQIKPPEGDGA